MTSNAGQKRLIHFDLSQRALDSLGIASSAAYRYIHSWMDKHGFDHDQLSGYISRMPLQDRQIFALHRIFVRENPQLASCLEGFRVTRVDEGMDLSEKTTQTLEQIDSHLADISRASRSIREARNATNTINLKHPHLHR